MLTVTEKAQKEIARYFEENALKPIRIFLSSSRSGPQIAIALDESKPEDAVFEIAGIQYLVEKTFLDRSQPLEIDFDANGFKIDSALELTPGCAGCGSSDRCCS